MIKEAQVYWLSLPDTQLITQCLASHREKQHNEVVGRVLLELASFEARFDAQAEKIKKLRRASHIEDNKYPVYLTDDEREIVVTLVPLPIGTMTDLRR